MNWVLHVVSKKWSIYFVWNAVIFRYKMVLIDAFLFCLPPWQASRCLGLLQLEDFPTKSRQICIFQHSLVLALKLAYSIQRFFQEILSREDGYFDWLINLHCCLSSSSNNSPDLLEVAPSCYRTWRSDQGLHPITARTQGLLQHISSFTCKPSCLFRTSNNHT